MGCDPYRKYLNHRPKRMGSKVEAREMPEPELGKQGEGLLDEEPPLSEAEKRLVIESLFTAWLKQPDQRLGQLIINALVAARAGSLYRVSDLHLAYVVDEFSDKILRAEATLAEAR